MLSACRLLICCDPYFVCRVRFDPAMKGASTSHGALLGEGAAWLNGQKVTAADGYWDCKFDNDPIEYILLLSPRTLDRDDMVEGSWALTVPK